jgi:hypothetical protein
MLLDQLFLINDGLIKYSAALRSEQQSIFFLLSLRGLLAYVIAASWLIGQGQFSPKNLFSLNDIRLRGCIKVLLTDTFFASMLLRPLSNVHTIMFSVPLMITASEAVLLKE